MTIIYHTFLREFSGETPKEIVDELYIESAAGTGQSLEAWWDYQSRLLADFKIVAPDIHAPDAHAKLLAGLTSIHAVEEGPKPTLDSRKPGMP